MLLQSGGRGEGQIRELVQLKDSIVGEILCNFGGFFWGGAWFGFVWDVGGVVFWFWVYFLTQSALQCINGVVRHMVRLTQVRRLKRVAEAQGYLRQACCSERLVFFFCFTHCILILYIDSSSEPKELI